MATAKLIDYTGAGRADEMTHAADVLIFSKSTRLNLSPDLFDRVKAMSYEDKLQELRAMASTIPSSWEMVSVTFLVSGLSRAAAQQMTRTRTASYAMQSQRVTDVSEAAVYNPHEEGTQEAEKFDAAADAAMEQYETLLADGMAPQDARGVLPMNVECNLLARYSLRSFVELVRARESMRVQGEYADLVSQMKREVINAWPWSETFFEPPNKKAIELLSEVVEEMGFSVGSGPGWKIAKATDLLRKE